MHVNVRLFADLRERHGAGETRLEVADDATVADVWEALTGEASLPAHVLSAINLEYADSGAVVKDGDEIGFFPPVTGG